MPVSISVGVSDAEDTAQAFMAAAEDAAAGLDGGCDLCVVFAGAAHLQDPRRPRDRPLAARPGRADRLRRGRCDRRRGWSWRTSAGAVVWALSAPGAEVEAMELTSVADGRRDGAGRPARGPGRAGRRAHRPGRPALLLGRRTAPPPQRGAARDAGPGRPRERGHARAPPASFSTTTWSTRARWR